MDERSREEILDESSSCSVISMPCITIRIGTLKYNPKENVVISKNGIQMMAPSLLDRRKTAIRIQISDIYKILVHCGKGTPVLFVYSVQSFGNYVRQALHMKEDGTSEYYNPVSKENPFKRIAIIPKRLSEEQVGILKKGFGMNVDRLSWREANYILGVISVRDDQLAPEKLLNDENILKKKPLLIYPPAGNCRISIYPEDYQRLAKDRFLNDVIIEFFLLYLMNEVLTEEQLSRTHIFSPFFYTRLTTEPPIANKTTDSGEGDSSITVAQNRHARVKKWTKKVDIFSKDFIIVPINENLHWFLAIICFPYLVQPSPIPKKRKAKEGNTTRNDTLNETNELEESDVEEEDEIFNLSEHFKKLRIANNQTEVVKQPCILVLDSLGASRLTVADALRDYLTCEFKAKMGGERIFTTHNMKASCPETPQQNNLTDCGLYLLQYVEQFFKVPIQDYTLPIKQLKNWFDGTLVARKREEISDLIKQLMPPRSTHPEIKFRGKSKETSTSQAVPPPTTHMINAEHSIDASQATEE